MTVRKTINKTQLQIAPSKEELAATRRMRMRHAIERMKSESRSQLAFTPQQTWQMPKPLPGVLPKGATMAMDDATSVYSGWAQNYSAFAEGQAFLGYPYLSELSQRPEYRVISETWAQEMTRKWIKLVSTGDEKLSDKTDKLKHLEDVMKRLKVQECFRKCTELDGFFGRAQIYLDLGVNRLNTEELKTTIGDGSGGISKVKIKLKSLKRLKVIEPVWTYPNAYNAVDPLASDFFTPTTWYIMGQEIHTTRLLTFIGRPVPDLLRPMYSFGGLSLSQMAKPYVDNWLRTRQSVSDAISNYSIMMMFTDMSAMLTEGAALDLETRADFFNVTRDNRGLMLADKNSEDIKNVSMPLGGLDHLQAQAQEHQAAVSQIPLVKLTGVSPSGLNATSEWEVKVFYDKVEAQQVAYFSEHLTKLLNIIQLSEYGVIDPEIGYEYNSLESGDDTEDTTNQKTQADTDTAYMTAGVISPQEVRTKIAADKNSPYASLDTSPEALPMPPAQPGQETDESGNPMDAEHSDLDHSDADGHQTQTAGSVSQGAAKSNTQKNPVQSKPVAGAHDENPNHDPENGEFTAGGGTSHKMQKRTPSGERIGGEKNQPKKESSGNHELPVDSDNKVPLVHYSSTKGIQTLDPQYYGTAAGGGESKRRDSDPDNWIDRTYYGIGDTYKKESMLGNVKYTAKIDADKLYDFAGDPDNLHKKVEDGNELNVYEKAISKAGYEGYYVDRPGMGTVAAVFTPLEVDKSDNDVIKLSGPSAETKSSTKLFFDDLVAQSQINPFDDRERIIGKAGVELHKNIDGTVHINFIRSLEQSGGHASKALDKVCELADEHGVTLDLEAAPMPNHVKDKKAAFSKTQLIAWYGRHGFKSVTKRGDHDHMVRVPKEIASDEWNAALHPRGQPDNAGEFVEVAGVSASKQYDKPKGTLPDDSPLLIDSQQDNTPEAQAERRAIVINAFAKAKPVVGRKPILFMMSGGGGAGKSSLLKKLQKTGDVPNEESGAVFVNSDDIKTLLKHYKDIFAAGDYRASMVVHEDSSKMSKDILSAAKGAHYDIVFDATMSDHNKGMRRINEFKAAGYEVRMFNVTTDPQLAVERAMNRYKDTGRYVDPEEIQYAHARFGQALPDYEKSVDYFRTYSNIDKFKLERASDKPQDKMQKRPVTTGRKILFEVAPNPNDKELSAKWNIMDETARSAVSTQVLNEILPEVLQKVGVHATMRMQYGGYGDDTNPSVSLSLGKGTTDEQADRLTRSLGSILQQDSMSRVSEKPFKGSYESGAVFVKVPKNISYNAVKIMYNKLRSNVLDASGKPLITGHTTDAGMMSILVDKEQSESIGRQVSQVLGEEYDVWHDTMNVAWPEKGEDDYGFQRESKTVGTSTNAPMGAWINSVRAKAEKLRDKGISSFGKEKAGG